MSEPIKMPALGESVTEGTVTQWLKEIGDSIEVDEPLLEVSTDKVDTEIPSPVAGVLEKIEVQEDETAEVGAILAYVGDGSGGGSDDESADDESADEEPKEEPKDESAEEPKEEPKEEPAEEPAEDDSSDDDEGDKAEKSEKKSAGGGEGEAVTMPALGESVTEGTVTQWLKEVGDEVEADEPLLEVSTDKVDTEVPSPIAGTLQKIVVGEDETVEVGAVLAYIGDGSGRGSDDESADEEPAEEPKEEPKEESEEAPAKETDEDTSRDEEKNSDELKDAEGESTESEDKAKDGEPKAETPEDETVQAEEVSGEKPAGEENVAQTPDLTKVDENIAKEQEDPQGRLAGEASSSNVYVTPIVRKLARQLEVDLEKVKGTGVGGRIRRQDVEAAAEEAKKAAEAPAEAPAAAPAAAADKAPGVPAGKTTVEASPLRGKTEKMTRLRQVISKRMVESLQTSAQLTTVVEVDVTRVVALRSKAKDAFAAKEGAKLTFLPFFVKAATEALKLNASINDKEVTYHDHEHIGIAVDTDRGLMVPVIRNAGDLNIAGIAKAINDLAARTRDAKVSPDELSGSTFTITNTGSGGALFDTPIINQPEVAILGVGTIFKRPAVVVDEFGTESIGIRSFCYLSISYDHRLVDGADAARYLQTVKNRLEEGDFAAEVGL